MLCLNWRFVGPACGIPYMVATVGYMLRHMWLVLQSAKKLQTLYNTTGPGKASRRRDHSCTE